MCIKKSHKAGFTLVEMLITVAIITIAMVVIVVAVDPAKRTRAARDSVRYTATRSLVDAIKKKQIDDLGVLPAGIDTTLRMLGTDGAGCNVSCGFSGTESTGTTNLALNQTATASTYYSASYSPDKANDGNTSNFWLNSLTGPDGQWWQVDLGQTYSVNQATIRWYNTSGSYNCYEMRILGSDNGVDFDVVYGPVDTSSDPQESTYSFGSTSYRYWRFMCDDAVNSNFVVLREVRVFEAIQETSETDPVCLDLSTELENYIAEIPMDPLIGTPAKTYYAIQETTNGHFQIRSCNPELDEEINLAN